MQAEWCHMVTGMSVPTAARFQSARWRDAVPGFLRRTLSTMLVALIPLFTTSAAAAQEAATANGVYEVTGIVIGTAADGLVGETTSSGHVVGDDDRLVGLPGCTVSSCPWVAPGSGDGAWGPQTSCAEWDGLCWVELTNPASGACATAPVLDLGPFFVRDNWWAATAERTYGLPQGEPAVARAALGADLGFGPGRSDDGYDATGVPDPAAINVAAGTWSDLGLTLDQGGAPLVVRLLWQAEIFRADACDSSTAPSDNATAIDDVNLRDAPDFGGEIVGTIRLGSRLHVTGDAAAGYLPVSHGDREGWVAADYLLLDSAAPATTTALAQLRTEPDASGTSVAVLQPGTAVYPTGPAEAGHLPVRTDDGGGGWVAADHVGFWSP